MSKSAFPIDITINLARVRANAWSIKRRTRRSLIAVVKSDAYGLGAVEVAKVLAGVADEFAYFSLEEARRVKQPGIVLGPLSGSPEAHVRFRVRPAVSSLAEARVVGRIPVALNVDTGMRWLGCSPEQIDAICRSCNVVEAFTHNITVTGARALKMYCEGKVPRLHAAASRLLNRPSTWLDAVRPGLALYRGAVAVATRLSFVRDLDGPAGYQRFRAVRAGVILCGYSQGFAPGVVLVKGCRRRVLEVGMNTALVEIGPRDAVGDPVVLLGGSLTEDAVAKAIGCTPHEVLCRFTGLGPRQYRGIR